MIGETARKISVRIEPQPPELKSPAFYDYCRKIHLFPRPIDSSNLTPERIVQVLDAIRRIEGWRGEIYQRLDALGYLPVQKGGMVLSMGSDTAALLALVLELEMVRLNLDARLALTVAHSPADVKGSDAEENRHHTSITAADPTLPPGVYAVIGPNVYSGSDLVKVRTHPSAGKGYFTSYGPPLGRFRERVYLDDLGDEAIWDPSALAARREARMRGHLALSRWQDFQDRPKDMGYVEHLVASRETPIKVFQAALRRIKGHVNDSTQGALVIHGRFFWRRHTDESEHLSPTFLADFKKLLEEAAAANVLVYTVSRRTATRVNGRAEKCDQLTHRDFIYEPLKLLPQFFSYEKATAKLSWLLRYFTPAHTAELMSENLAGEFLTSGLLPDEFRSKGYPPNNPSKGSAVVAAFLGMEADSLRDAVEALLAEKTGRHRTLYIYGWGDGNLPFGADSIHELLTDALKAQGLPAHLQPIQKHLPQAKGWDMEGGPKNLVSEDRDEPTLLKLVRETLLKLTPEERRQLLSGYQINPRAFGHFSRAQRPPLPDDQPVQVVEGHFDVFSEELAKRVIKDLLMHANPMLRELGRAADQGIHVEMQTQAFASKANILLYELGQMSYAVGVRDEVNRSWMRGIFRRPTGTAS